MPNCRDSNFAQPHEDMNQLEDSNWVIFSLPDEKGIGDGILNLSPTLPCIMAKLLFNSYFDI